MVREGQLIVRIQDDQLVASLDAAVAAEKQASDHLRDLQLGPRPQEIDQATAAVHQSQSQLEKLQNGSRPEEIAAARAALGQANERLALVKNGPRKEDIALARANLDAAAADREYAKSNLTRMEKLAAEGAIAARDLDQAGDASSVAQEKEDALRQALDELLAGSRVEDIRAAEHAVKQARGELCPREERSRGPRTSEPPRQLCGNPNPRSPTSKPEPENSRSPKPPLRSSRPTRRCGRSRPTSASGPCSRPCRASCSC